MLLRMSARTRVCAFYCFVFSSLIHSVNVMGQSGTITGNEFNPALSLILDGRYTDYNDAFALPGFQLGGEAGMAPKGFSLGHSEIAMSSNIDDFFYGYTNLALAEDDGETVVELEEAAVETSGLGNGLTIKFGKFFSGIGYLNSVHEHAHDFTDVPLVYAAMVGNHLVDSGVQIKWVAPTDLYWETGVELTRGTAYPGGESADNNNGTAVYSKLGGDIDVSSSWQLGGFWFATEYDARAGGEHSQVEGVENNDGDVELYGVDMVYKWAPQGNVSERNLKIQFEYFARDEEATINLAQDIGDFSTDYEGSHAGYYVQSVYQFVPHWRTGLRYNWLEPDNSFKNVSENGVAFDEFLTVTALGSDEVITGVSAMVDYSRSEFSRIRLQLNQVDIGESSDTQIMLQYLMSLGSHGAHKF